MILALDVGNTEIYGGVFDGTKLLLQFRKTSKTGVSSDEVGLFLRAVLRENNIDPNDIKRVGLCSVVPGLIHSLRNCSMKYFNVKPFILQAGVRTGLKIGYRNPLEVGADRIANAIAATQIYPGKNLIVIDFGTATTFCAITKDKDYLGGIILPGLRISMEALESKTARLPTVEIVKPKDVVGRSTVESIQSGLYFGHLSAIQSISERIRKEKFQNEETLIIGTGGFSSLFSKEGVFDILISDLVLQGIRFALEMSEPEKTFSPGKRTEIEAAL